MPAALRPLPEPDPPLVRNTGRPTARLIAPALPLSSCVRAYLSRNTVGAELAPQERDNHFPATPVCAITWFIQGECSLLRHGVREVNIRMPGPAVFFGPQTQPVMSRNPGPVQAFMLVLMPDALHALTGLDIGAHMDRFAAVDEVFDADWQAMSRAVLAAGSDAERIRHIEAFIGPRWAAARQDGAVQPHRYQDWVQGLAVRAAASGVGRGLRQVERRIKHWTGSPLRHLRGLGRAEHSFLMARSAQEHGTLDWADIAVDTGFTDQSHLCRESRRVTGLTPTELARRVLQDESFWAYRIWS